jgi:arylsulfatase A-like enzyme
MGRSLALIALCTSLAAWPSFAASRDAAPRPNLIYILADDAGVDDFSAYGGMHIRTPNIDRLADEGMLFTQHYAGSTVCAPSRSVLMTGLHTGHTRIRGNGTVPLRDEDLTVAEVLKRAGYATAAIGKWGLGEAGSSGTPGRQGFDFFFGYLNQANAHRYYPPFLYKNDEKIEYAGNPRTRSHYSHDLMTEQAEAFIERNRERRFFLYLAYTVPHVDLDVPEDSMRPYRNALGPETPFAPIFHHYRKHATPKAAYAGMISRLDRDVGRILARLSAAGIDRDTVVFFSSDNGRAIEGGSPAAFFGSDSPLRGHKRELYEGGIRAPLLARWPGRIPPGTESEHLSGFQDLLPTAADLAEVELKEEVDGISFLPTLLGEEGGQNVHDQLYWEFDEWGGKQAIRRGRWKLIRQGQRCTPIFFGAMRWCWGSRVELYDLEEDPSEAVDRAADYPEMVRRLTGELDREHTPSREFPLPFYGE